MLFVPAATSYTNLYNVLNFPAGVVPVSTVTRADEEELKHYRGHYRDPWDKRLKEVSRKRAQVLATSRVTLLGLSPGLSTSPSETGSLFSGAVCIHCSSTPWCSRAGVCQPGSCALICLPLPSLPAVSRACLGALTQHCP